MDSLLIGHISRMINKVLETVKMVYRDKKSDYIDFDEIESFSYTRSRSIELELEIDL